MDAYSFWRRGVPYVFLNTMKSAERSRMDAAHELATSCCTGRAEPRDEQANTWRSGSPRRS